MIIIRGPEVFRTWVSIIDVDRSEYYGKIIQEGLGTGAGSRGGTPVGVFGMKQWRRVHWARLGLARPLIRNIQKKNNKKNLNPCQQMLFLSSKYSQIAFAAGSLSAPQTP